MSDYFEIRERLETLNTLASSERIAATFLDAWHLESSSTDCWTHLYDVRRDESPYDLRDEMSHYMMQTETQNKLRSWNPSYGNRLPQTVLWIMDRKHPDNRRAFESMDMDRAQFVRELLAHEHFGLRMRFEVAQCPYFLQFLPEEERWSMLETAVREFGTAINWSWPYYTANKWEKDRTTKLVRQLIEDPDLAGGFLAGDDAQIGWLAWSTLADFLEIILEAAKRAPYEAQANRQWIATCIGDRKVNPGNSFLVAHPYWPNCPEQYHKELGPKGEAETAKLLEQAFAYMATANEMNLSVSSRLLQKKLLDMMTKPTIEARDARKITEILVDMPNCLVGRQLMDRLLNECKLKELGDTYRWLRCSVRRFSRIRLLVLGENGAFFWNDNHFSQADDWFCRYLQAGMEERGWQFKTLEHRRNERVIENSPRAYDAQIQMNGKYAGVWKVRHGHRGGDYIMTRPVQPDQDPEVMMVPPDFNPGQPVFTKGTFRIYQTNDRLSPAKEWSSDYIKWH